MPDVVAILRVVEALPHDFAVMCAEATAEGVRNMAALAAEFGSEGDPFRDPGALFAAFVAGELAGVARALAGAMMQQGFQAAPLLVLNAAASAAAPPFWEAMGFERVEWDGVTHALRL